MTISYVMDDGARRGDKNAWPTAEQAIEKALEAARKLQRAVSVWEWDSERKGEWPQVPSARLHYCLVFPDGSSQKSAKGANPFKVVMDESSDGGSEGADSVEKQLGLPTITLGSLTQEIDTIMHDLAGKLDAQLMNRLNRVGDTIAKAAVERQERSAKVAGSFKVKKSYRIGGEAYTVEAIDGTDGTVTLRGPEGVVSQISALSLARELVRAADAPAPAAPPPAVEDEQAKQAQPEEAPAPEAPEELPEAKESRLKPGDIAVMDERDRVFVLDSADEVYVVLQEGQIQTVPDDVTRIRPTSDAGDPDAKKARRVWQAFYKSLLKFFDVQSVDEMDSEQKSRMFDMARRKWPKVQRQLIDNEKPAEKEAQPEEEAKEEAPTAPTREAPAPEMPQAASVKTVAHDLDEDYNREEYYDEAPTEDISFVLGDDVEQLLAKIGLTDKVAYDIDSDSANSPDEGWFVRFTIEAGDDAASLPAIEKALASNPMFTNVTNEGDSLRADFVSDYIGQALDEASRKAQDSGAFSSSWANGPTLLSYCMDILSNDVEASAKLAMSFMAASLRDATKLRAMKAMKKFEGHELPKSWFDTAMLLAESSKRSNVRASKDIDLTPPKDVQKIAARALDRASKENVTLPSVTLQHAKLLVAGKPVSLEAAERMHLYLTRHHMTAKSELLWDAWGGHAGKRWVAKLAKMINPMQAGLVRAEWKQAFRAQLGAIITRELKDGGLAEADFSIVHRSDGVTQIAAKTHRHGALVGQRAAALGWRLVSASLGDQEFFSLNGGPGVEKLYYEANRAYHKELGVPWTAEAERAWQHRIARAEKRE